MRTWCILAAHVLMLAGCGVYAQHNAELISGNEEQVTVKSGVSANPGTLASAHCSQYGKDAVLDSINPLPGSFNYSLYEFRCTGRQTQPQAGAPQGSEAVLEAITAGSAFAVSGDGNFLTNQHVVAGCDSAILSFEGETSSAAIIARDTANDLALLKSSSFPTATATFRGGQGVRPGDPIVAIGFPLRGWLAEGPTVTTGSVSALAGLGNDARFLQITAPVQSGNSGGPLLDSSGNVVGIVVSKLDALTVAALTGDIPQNVNFAIRSQIAQIFLEANDVAYNVAVSQATYAPADIAQHARQFMAAVECQR